MADFRRAWDRSPQSGEATARAKAQAMTSFCCRWHAYFALALLAFVALHIGVAIQDYMTDQRQ